MVQELIIKSFLILIAGLSHNYGLSPPHPPVPKSASVVYRGQHFETMVLIWAFLTRVVAMSLSIFHVAVICALQFPASPNSTLILTKLCPYPSSNLPSIGQLNSPFIVGATAMVMACVLRAWCFATLGPLFTYLVTVVPGHSLVTSGPYAYVRHPSYTGVFLMLVSAAFTYLLSPGNYVNECGIMMTPWKWLIWYWAGCCTFSVFSLRNRGRVEDELMKKTFHREWAEYQKSVPYSFVPYLV